MNLLKDLGEIATEFMAGVPIESIIEQDNKPKYQQITRVYAFPPWGKVQEVSHDKVVAIYEDQKLQRKLARNHFFKQFFLLDERSVEEVYAVHGRDGWGNIIENPDNLRRYRAQFGLDENGKKVKK